MKMGL